MGYNFHSEGTAIQKMNQEFGSTCSWLQLQICLFICQVESVRRQRRDFCSLRVQLNCWSNCKPILYVFSECQLRPALKATSSSTLIELQQYRYYSYRIHNAAFLQWVVLTYLSVQLKSFFFPGAQFLGLPAASPTYTNSSTGRPPFPSELSHFQVPMLGFLYFPRFLIART